MRKKILITGTAGFIGFHLAKEMLKMNYDVVGLDNINDYYDVSLKYARLAQCGIFETENIEYNKLVKSKQYENYSFIKLNLEDETNINALFYEQKFDKVINLAAQAGVRYSLTNPKVYLTSNIEGFLNILEASRKNAIQHLVFASSSSVYGNNKELPFSTSQNVDHPISLYAASKKSNELMAHVYSHLYKLPCTGLRFFTVYGPWGRPDMAMNIFAESMLQNKPIILFNNGDMVRDFTYVEDIVDGIVKVCDEIPKAMPNSENIPSISRTAPYQIFNIGNTNKISLQELVNYLEQEIGIKAIIEYQPLQSGDVQATLSDITDLNLAVGYSAKTDFKTGIKKFVTWFRSYYNL